MKLLYVVLLLSILKSTSLLAADNSSMTLPTDESAEKKLRAKHKQIIDWWLDKTAHSLAILESNGCDVNESHARLLEQFDPEKFKHNPELQETARFVIEKINYAREQINDEGFLLRR